MDLADTQNRQHTNLPHYDDQKFHYVGSEHIKLASELEDQLTSQHSKSIAIVGLVGTGYFSLF